MYVYVEEYRYGQDRVAWFEGLSAKPGDVISVGESFGICLGKHCAFPELVTHHEKKQHDILLKKLLSPDALKIIHWMVGHRYSSYRNVLPLFVGSDIRSLVARKKGISKKKVQASSFILQGERLVWGGEHGQTLCVFPDLWSMFQSLPGSLAKNSSVAILHGKNTKKQKEEAFWGLATNRIQLLCATYSQVFQNWWGLKQIVCLQDHAWRYKNQQDPRYYLPTVLEYMHQTYDTSLISKGHRLQKV